MEGLPRFLSPEDDPGDDSSDGNDKKTPKARRREVGRMVAGVEKSADTRDKKEDVARKSASFLDKILGEKPASAEQPLTRATETTGGQKIEPEDRPELSQAEQVAEEQVAEHLAETGDVTPEEIADIPEYRDRAVIDNALDKAAESDMASVTAEDEAPISTNESPEPSDGDMQEASLEGVEFTVPHEQSQMPDLGNEADAADTDDVPYSASATAASAASPPSATGSSAAASAAAGSGGGAAGGRSSVPAPPVPPATAMPAPLPRRSATPPTSRSAYSSAAPSPGHGSVTPPSASSAYRSPNVARATVDAEDQAFRRGRNRGLIAGLIIGGGIEHIRHKRREKKREKAIELTFARERKEQAKNLENVRWDHIREQQSEKVRQAAAEKYQLPVQREAPKTPSAEAVTTSPQPVTERIVRTVPEVSLGSQQTAQEVLVQKQVAEQQRIVQHVEQVKQEQLAELGIAQGNRVERSAWHNIEVDKMGKAVQGSSFEYGHEYYQERAHETGSKTKQQVDAVAGEVALVAAALSESARSRDFEPGQPSTPDQLRSSKKQKKARLDAARTSTAAGVAMPGRPSTLPEGSAGSSSSKSKSILTAVTTPPTTTAGTIGWFFVLVALGFVYFFLLT